MNPLPVAPPGPLQVLTATAAWPFPAEDRAEMALRAKLREQLLDDLTPRDGSPVLVDRIPNWATLTVTGPHLQADRGRTWFAYTATVSTVPVRAIHPPASPGPAATH